MYLPDGRIQTVKYTADHHNGYNAKVSYEGTTTYLPPISVTSLSVPSSSVPSLSVPSSSSVPYKYTYQVKKPYNKVTLYDLETSSYKTPIPYKDLTPITIYDPRTLYRNNYVPK